MLTFQHRGVRADQGMGEIRWKAGHVAAGDQNAAHAMPMGLMQGGGEAAQGAHVRAGAIRQCGVNRMCPPTYHHPRAKRRQSRHGMIEQRRLAQHRLRLVAAKAG
jgi:hypothetical protein